MATRATFPPGLICVPQRLRFRNPHASGRRRMDFCNGSRPVGRVLRAIHPTRPACTRRARRERIAAATHVWRSLGRMDASRQGVARVPPVCDCTAQYLDEPSQSPQTGNQAASSPMPTNDTSSQPYSGKRTACWGVPSSLRGRRSDALHRATSTGLAQGETHTGRTSRRRPFLGHPYCRRQTSAGRFGRRSTVEGSACHAQKNTVAVT